MRRYDTAGRFAVEYTLQDEKMRRCNTKL